MLIKTKNHKSKSAYTLIELSIVISIIAVLMTGAIGISVSSINISKKNSTISKIDTLYSAIGKFIMINKRLPCPSSLNLLNNESQFGIERVNDNGGCLSTSTNGVFTSGNLYYGAIPVKSLGLSLDTAQDDFGSKFSYIIDNRFAGQFLEIPDFTKSTFGTIENLTSMTVSQRVLLQNPRIITTDAILIILSHGLNKSGAFNYGSSSQNSNASDVDEASNQLQSGVFDNSFIANSVDGNIFDDIVFFKTRNQIVSDFNLYHIIACKQDATFTTPVYYGNIIYLSQCSTTYRRVPEAFCDKFGKLVIYNKCP